jgi:uncharacterized protein
MVALAQPLLHGRRAVLEWDMSRVEVFAVRVRPGASRTAVGGRYDGPFGPAVVVTVGAPAVDGRATDAALRAAAEALGVRPSTLTLQTGRRGRDKLFAVADPPADLAHRLELLLGDGKGQ